MKKIDTRPMAYFFGLLLLASALVVSSKESSIGPLPCPVEFKGSQEAIPKSMRAEMKKTCWRPGCPVALSDLRYLRVSYWTFDSNVAEGELVIHKNVADEVLAIFRELFQARFPMAKMRLIQSYGGDDDKSMADNNTSAFNCRAIKGRPGVFSKHSWGRAIDINPLLNPFVKNGQVSPPAAKTYANRSQLRPGMIQKGDVVTRAFAKHGWRWGGNWRRSKDYQHFEKF